VRALAGILLCAATSVVAPSAAAGAAVNPAAALIERGVVAMRTNPESSRRDAEEALLVLQRQPDTDLEIRAHLLLCDYEAERDATAAAEQIAAARALLPRAQRPGLAAGVLNCAGAMHENAGENEQARSLYEQAVAAATAAHDDGMLAETLFSRGYLLGLIGEYTAGLADLRRAQALFEKRNMPRHALTVLNSIATLYNRMGDYEQAKHIYTQALHDQHAAGMLREEAVTLHNMGKVHERLHEWREARQAFAGALDISRQIDYQRGEAYALRGLAAVDDAMGDPKGAMQHLDQAEALRQKIPDARLRAQIALERGIALHGLGRLTESRAALESARAVLESAGALGELAPVYSELAAIQAEVGDWRGAYQRERDYAQLSQKLYSNQLDQRFATLKVEFDTAAKEKENAALVRENEANRKALEQGRSVRRLQAAVIALTVVLASVLATLALHQRGSSLRMRRLAMTDELTGVPNRRAVLDRLGAHLREEQTAPCSILIMDIDHFKGINDQHGHAAGDEVLKLVATAVRNAVIEPAFFGRLGGEEFLVALPATPLDEARRVAEAFRSRIMSVDPGRWCADRRTITASIGVTMQIVTDDSPSSLLKRADMALYAAKRSGRNCVRTEPSSADQDAPVGENAASILGVHELDPDVPLAGGGARRA
jgi:diguanylate cyclase (GGDEF)-like protein